MKNEWFRFGDAVAMIASLYMIVFLVLEWIDRFSRGFGTFERWQYAGYTWWRVFFALSALFLVVWSRYRYREEIPGWFLVCLAFVVFSGIVSLVVRLR
ncbi:MAG: hypothetical protein HY318_01420 [Armatimonadetes bacterium]|nr:hypothetical protein [Armatimonadota bacterium]